jgi:FkbM family methyltransferase
MQQEAQKIGYFQRRKLSSFYQNFVGNADLAFVFGDQSGNISDLLAQMGVKVICIQPIAAFIPTLVTKLAKTSNCIVINEDVGAFQTEFFYNGIYEKNILPYSSNLSASENQEYVKITTLDELIMRFGQPSLCHINGEGYEGEVLKGLNKPIPYIITTFYSFTQEKTAAILRRLLQLGDYEFNWKLAEATAPIAKKWMSAKELNQSMFKYGKDNFSGEILARLKFPFDEI